MKRKCPSCENAMPLIYFSKKANGEHRAKCDICINELKPAHRLQQTKPAPDDNHLLPKIVLDAMYMEQENADGIALKHNAPKDKPECGGQKRCCACKEDLPTNAYRFHVINKVKHYESSCRECIKNQ